MPTNSSKNKSKTLYLACGELKIQAQGYWFTLGGEKGSFGFYPHLKQQEKGCFYPLYADTQLKGDIRAALKWLQNLAIKPADISGMLIKKMLGEKGSPNASLLALTDLRLTEESKKKWFPERFAVRPVCEIMDETRTNKSKMLAFHEYAYLEGLELETRLHLGYLSSQDELKSMKSLISKALPLISGIGAMRSRGFGAGVVKLVWGEDVKVEAPTAFTNTPCGEYQYSLCALVNFRNRPMGHGQTQLIPAHTHITSKKIRSWFCQAYSQLFGQWPSLEEMARIKFPSLYPTLLKDGEQFQAYPPPVTTLKMEDLTIEDQYGHERDRNKYAERKTLVRIKSKPLTEGEYLTNQRTPKVMNVHKEIRVRNSMKDNYATLDEAGLIVQESLCQGIIFSGKVQLAHCEDLFIARAFFVLKNMKPRINGAIFNPTIQKFQGIAADEGGKQSQVELLTEQAEFTHSLAKEKMLCRNLGTSRSYNATLRRPRRNRIVFMPGSLIKGHNDDRSLPWPGLGQKAAPPQAEFENRTCESIEETIPVSTNAIAEISRAQLGILRGFQHKSPEVSIRIIESLLEKYEKWIRKNERVAKNLLPKSIMEELLNRLKTEGTESCKAYIQTILEDYSSTEWEKNRDRIAAKLAVKKEASNGTAQ